MLVGTLASVSIYFWNDIQERKRADIARQQKQAEEKARREAEYRKRNMVTRIYKPSAPFRTVATPRVGTPAPTVQSSDKVFSLDNPHLLAQDCDRRFSRALASKPDARMHVRDVARTIEGQMIDRFTEVH